MQSNKKAMTLNEIMLAMVILAVSFIPIMGVLSSSIKTTEKDDHIIKGMQLCQEKLGIALQFPFNYFKDATYTTKINSPDPNHNLELILGTETFRINYYSTLNVKTEPVKFCEVPIFDFTEIDSKSIASLSINAEVDKAKIRGWYTKKDFTVNGRVKRYTVTVTWEEKEGGSSEAKKRFYTLSTLKCDVRK